MDKLRERVNTAEYWVDKHGEKVGELDGNVGQVRAYVVATLEKVESEVERRLVTEDFRRVMKMFNEFLILRSRDSEDQRNSLRDTVTFLKYYLPHLIQLQISDNLVPFATQCA